MDLDKKQAAQDIKDATAALNEKIVAGIKLGLSTYIVDNPYTDKEGIKVSCTITEKVIY